MKTIIFSIIIPTLNEEKSLPRLLRSLAKQTYREFEVIVVDGSSDDETLKRAKEFTAQLPSLTITTSRKRNVGEQRNIGAVNAKGKYLVFFDADVQIPPTFLAKINMHIEKEKSFFITTWLRPDSHNHQDKLVVAVTNIGIETAQKIDKSFVAGFNIIVHRLVFEQMGGFDQNVVHAEDHDFSFRCHRAGIRLRILRQPRLVMSLRRFRKEGYFAILKKYTRSSLYLLLRGPIKKALFEYEMGGHVYERGKPVTQSTLKRMEDSIRKSFQTMLNSKG